MGLGLGLGFRVRVRVRRRRDLGLRRARAPSLVQALVLAVEIEQVRVVHLEARRLRVLVEHDVARVLTHEGARPKPIERTHAPSPAKRLEDLQSRAHAAADHPVEAVGGAVAARVALEDAV